MAAAAAASPHENRASVEYEENISCSRAQKSVSPLTPTTATTRDAISRAWSFSHSLTYAAPSPATTSSAPRPDLDARRDGSAVNVDAMPTRSPLLFSSRSE